MGIFRTSATPDVPLVVSITGVRLGHRVLLVPGTDRKALVEIASRVGLTGRTLAVAPGDAGRRLQADMERAGLVVDLAELAMPLPVPDEAFDLALVDDRAPRPREFETAALLPGLRSALRPGGRLLVLLSAGGGPLMRLFGGSAAPVGAPGLLTALSDAGFRACRLVTVRDGVGFVEGSTPSA